METEGNFIELRKSLDCLSGDFNHISDRLKVLRKEFKNDGDLTCQTDSISQILFKNKMTLYRIENKSNTGYKEVMRLILFFYQKGINPMWIIIKENSSIDKYITPN